MQYSKQVTIYLLKKSFEKSIFATRENIEQKDYRIIFKYSF